MPTPICCGHSTLWTLDRIGKTRLFGPPASGAASAPSLPRSAPRPAAPRTAWPCTTGCRGIPVARLPASGFRRQGPGLRYYVCLWLRHWNYPVRGYGRASCINGLLIRFWPAPQSSGTVLAQRDWPSLRDCPPCHRISYVGCTKFAVLKTFDTACAFGFNQAGPEVAVWSAVVQAWAKARRAGTSLFAPGGLCRALNRHRMIPSGKSRGLEPSKGES